MVYDDGKRVAQQIVPPFSHNRCNFVEFLDIHRRLLQSWTEHLIVEGDWVIVLVQNNSHGHAGGIRSSVNGIENFGGSRIGA